jgi:competence protein ComEC
MTPLIRLGLAWIAGIVLAWWLNFPWEVVAWAVLPALGALLFYRRNPTARWTAILVFALAAGALRFIFSQPVINENHVAFYNDLPGSVTLTGIVDDEPDIRDNYVNLSLRAEALRLKGVTHVVTGWVLIRAPRYPEYSYGDRLTVSGRLETPPVFEDFSYRDYLARSDIHSLVLRCRLEYLAGNQGNPLWTLLFAFKKRAFQTINLILAEPHAALLNGILLGIRSGIPTDLYQAFNLTGTSHIIVISGSNIAVVVGILLLLGQKIIGKRLAPPLAISGIILYTLLVGADPSVSRAAVMGVVWVFAIWLGRPGLALNALVFSAVVLTLFNPLMLWDVGFQLSFMATLGLIVLSPVLERGFFGLLQPYLHDNRLNLVMALLSELVIITLAAQISTAPLIIYHFGRLSLVALLTNLLILPVQPLIMTLGGLAMLAGLLWLPLGQALAWLVWLPLAWTVLVAEWSARLPLASLSLDTFPLWLLGLSYAVIAAFIWWANRLTTPSAPRFHLPALGAMSTRLLLGGMAAVALLVWLVALSLPDGRLHVAFLDVGQGDAILVTLPDGQRLLVDGGPSAVQLNWRLGQQMPFWERTLALVVNTHPDTDHLAGLVSLFNHYQLGQVVVTNAVGKGEFYAQWQRQLAAANLTPLIGQAGMQLTWGNGVTGTILSPGPATGQPEDTNNRSLVLRLQMGRVSFLLPGDIEAPVEQALAHSGAPLAATVLKSAHHGSDTSSTEPLLAAVNPQIVIISVGADNRLGHPSPEVLARYLERGLTVLRTDQRGTIELSTDGEQLWVKTAR